MSSLINLQGEPWTPGPLHPTIGEHEVHVWRVNADLSPSALQQCRYALNAEELARADHFRFNSDRDRWIAARGLLRAGRLRALHLYRELQAISRFARTPPHGKPTLVLNDTDIDLRFNISHSDGVALFAFALAREVGVDVEQCPESILTQLRGEFAAQVFPTVRYWHCAIRCRRTEIRASSAIGRVKKPT